MDLVIKGGDDLGALAKRIKDVGDKTLRKELLRAIRVATKDTKAAIRANALAELPSRGGLAGVIARSRVSTKTRTTARHTGITIVATSQHNVKALDAGVLRHPVFGNRKKWAVQAVSSGWFTAPIEADADKVRSEISQAMAGIAAKIERG